MTKAYSTLLLFALLSVAAPGFLVADDVKQAGEVERKPRFEKHIAPIFKAKCVKCHNPLSKKAELDLTTPEALFKGGESGAIIEPGKLDESPLWEMVHEGLMPPEDEKPLEPNELGLIKAWISTGASLANGKDPRELLAAGEVNNHIIEPLMLLRCGYCHGSRIQEAGLDLRTKSSMLKGGKSGPAIVLGKPDESLLLKRIHKGQMPPPDKLILAGVKPMTSGELERLARWIELGAPEIEMLADVAGREADALVSDKDRQFWSFQPPRAHAPPRVKAGERVRNPIDAFLLEKLEQQQLTFSPEADKLTLLRRLSFDLTGVPPSPRDVQMVLDDDRPDAYERLVERLLASPRYGERWGRVWLDVAGYADSEGKRSADPIRPYAYKYRDYVIRSLNNDKPYDRFLLEQIAGDELADYENANQVTEEMVDNLIATGFLRMAPDGTGSDIVNFTPERLEVISDEIDIFSSSILGLTMKCARCHSHKYDPIPHRDYYRLAATFKGAFDEHDWLKPAFVPGQTKAVKPGRVLSYATPRQREEFEELNRKIEADIKELENQKLRLAESVRASHLKEQLASLPKPLHEDLRRTLATPATRRDEIQKYLAAKFAGQLQLTDKALKKHPAYSRAATEIDRQVKSLKSEKRDGIQIRALWDRGQPSPTYIYVRGDFHQVGRLVGPGVPSVLTDSKRPFEVKPPWPGSKKTGRRLALAKWLVEPDHPLTARVMVNRIWKHHFGQGIVNTLDNFGHLGARPTHPELLDWLAVRFVRQGWSIKDLHRLIVTSSAYRQSSQLTDEHLAKDPRNVLLSRMPLRRLEAEQLRDSLLLVSGRLNERPYGRPDLVNARKDGLVTSLPTPQGRRRSVFVRQRRKEIPTILETFDLPQMNPACQARPTSNVAQQALHLMNDKLVRQLSRSFAQQVRQGTADPHGRIRLVYLAALGRPPSDEEVELNLQALAELSEEWSKQLAKEKTAGDDAELRALTTFCHTILNSAGFLYID